jgi:hypothetical protein
MAYLHEGKGMNDLPETSDVMSILKTLETAGVKKIMEPTQAFLAIALLRTRSQAVLAEARNRIENIYGLTLKDVLNIVPNAQLLWTTILPNDSILLRDECERLKILHVTVQLVVFVSLLNQQKAVLLDEFIKTFPQLNLVPLKPEQLVPEAWPLLDKVLTKLNDAPSCPIVDALVQWRAKRDADAAATEAKPEPEATKPEEPVTKPEEPATKPLVISVAMAKQIIEIVDKRLLALEEAKLEQVAINAERRAIEKMAHEKFRSYLNSLGMGQYAE